MNYFYNNAFDFNMIYIDEHGRFVPFGARVDVDSEHEFKSFSHTENHYTTVMFINGLSNAEVKISRYKQWVTIATPIIEATLPYVNYTHANNFLGSINDFFGNYIKDNLLYGFPGIHKVKFNTMPIYTGKANPPPVFHYMIFDNQKIKAKTCFIDWELGELHRADCMSCQSMLKYLRDAAVMLDKQFFCFRRDITYQDENFVVIKNNLRLHKNTYKIVALSDPQEQGTNVELKHIMQYFTNSFEGILTLGHIHTLRLSDGFSKGIQTILNY